MTESNLTARTMRYLMGRRSPRDFDMDMDMVVVMVVMVVVVVVVVC
jgi:hypothetical protein